MWSGQKQWLGLLYLKVAPSRLDFLLIFPPPCLPQLFPCPKALSFEKFEPSWHLPNARTLRSVNSPVTRLSLRTIRPSSHEVPQPSRHLFHRGIQALSSSIRRPWILSKKAPGTRIAFCLMNSMHHGWVPSSLHASSPLASLIALPSIPGIASWACKRVKSPQENLVKTATDLTHRQHCLRSTRSRWSARSNPLPAILQVSRLDRGLLSRDTLLQCSSSIANRLKQTADISTKMDLRDLIPASNRLHHHRCHAGLLRPGLRPALPSWHFLFRQFGSRSCCK
jgi:hypothetical protein